MSDTKLPDREPSDDYSPGKWNRLQMHEPVMGTLWVGTADPPQTQSVWMATEDFRRYVNKLLNVFGHLTYAELQEKERKPE